MYLVVEGHGEVRAAGNLVSRIWGDHGRTTPWAEPIRWRNLERREGLTKAAELARSKRDAVGLLILRDEDDGCPKTRGPEAAGWLRALRLPFPTALVLLHREYEVLFLSCVADLAGRPLKGDDGQSRPGLLQGTTFVGDPESVRGVKEWLGDRFPPNRSYKPTFDQLPMTRMLKLQTLRAAGPPCFGTLERALHFLGQAGACDVYPPAA
jgi:hypothetical protein